MSNVRARSKMTPAIVDLLLFASSFLAASGLF